MSVGNYRQRQASRWEYTQHVSTLDSEYYTITIHVDICLGSFRGVNYYCIEIHVMVCLNIEVCAF